ncbi:MAG TPA: TipAS antibiotic-recognition domain-containing protein [Myxococcales bacterium]|nr:TipAS antibiotic-recognition domain-containing protein [Myxococcales bacterium]
MKYEDFFTTEQVADLKARGTSGSLRPADVAGRDWKRVAADIRVEFDKKTPPTSPRMQELARRWRGLIDEITGGDEGIRRGLVAIYRAEPGVTSEFFGPVVDDAVLKYIGKAVAALP